MKLRIENKYIYAIKLSPDEEKVIDDALAVKVPQFQHMPAYKMHKWDGNKRFYYKRYNSFLTGFLPFVLDLAQKHKFKVKLIDEREHPKISKKKIKRAKKFLREHQVRELDIILNSQIKWKKKSIPWIRGVAKHPTGCLTGDTELIINRGGNSKRKTLKEVYDIVNCRNRNKKFDKTITTQTQSLLDNRIGLNTITAAFYNGKQVVFEVKTKSGKLLTATLQHNFLTNKGWRPLEELTIGSYIAIWKPITPNTKYKPQYVIKSVKNHSFGYDEIISIRKIGKRKTYDLSLTDPYNNYVANGIIVHNSGKSFFAAGLSKALNVKTLVVVSSIELMYQLQANFQQVLKNEDIGILGDGKLEIAKRVNIGIVNTLYSRIQTPEVKELLQETELIIVDECHHDTPSKKSKVKGEKKKGMYFQVIKECPAYYRFGFSASPLVRGDLGDVQLIGDTGSLISVVERKELEKKKLLAKVKVYTIEINDPKLPKRIRDFAKVRKQAIVDNDYRNECIVREAETAIKRNDLTLILTNIVSHGKNLYRQLKYKDIPCIFLSGKSSKKKRKRVLKDVQKRKNGIVIVANRIYDEGVNAPNVKTLILAGGGASRIKSIQKVGRGTRPKENGKNIVKVVDFIDLTHEFLEKHSMERLTAYEAEGFKIIKM